MITFHGGPKNGLVADDLGHATPRFCIRRQSHPNSRPECGYAIYEPSEDRSVAFWSHNEWPGEYLIEEGTLWDL